MKDTSFSIPTSKLDRLSTCYWNEFDLETYGCWIDWCVPTRRPVTVFDAPEESLWATSPTFPSAASGLLSTAEDYMAFGQMMLRSGRYGDKRVLSRPTVEVMTTDQLTPHQKAVSGFFDGFFTARGWGFGLSVSTQRDHLSRPVGRFGWDGGFGTSWYSDPKEDLVGVITTQRAWSAPSPPTFLRDFWTLVYQAIDD
jgi:CubicO group peptidase (beta-lactamase class C family)